MHYGSFDLFGLSGEFGMSGPMGVAHGTQKFWQKLIESNHSFDQIHSSATLPPIYTSINVENIGLLLNNNLQVLVYLCL